MFIAQRDLDVQHPSTDLCQRGGGRKLCQLEAEEVRLGTATVLTAYNFSLATVSTFKYLGRLLLDGGGPQPQEGTK